MSVLNLKPDAPLWTGMTRIERKPNETQQQLDATKDSATFSVGQDSHKLVLDGKIDDVLLNGMGPVARERLITDIRDLSGRGAAIREVCLQSHDPLASAEVDLNTGQPWAAFPNYDSGHKIYGYELISGCGPQSLSVKLEDNGVVDVCVSTRYSASQTQHSMRAKLSEDGSCTPILEGVTWQLAP